jgi:hypothetical protein
MFTTECAVTVLITAAPVRALSWFKNHHPWRIRRCEMHAAGVAETHDAATVPDLQTQLEDLLSAVWAAEANWQLDDRLDLAVRRQRAVAERHARIAPDYRLKEVWY